MCKLKANKEDDNKQFYILGKKVQGKNVCEKKQKSRDEYHLGLYSPGTPDMFLFLSAVSTVLISPSMVARISGV